MSSPSHVTNSQIIFGSSNNMIVASVVLPEDLYTPLFQQAVNPSGYSRRLGGRIKDLDVDYGINVSRFTVRLLQDINILNIRNYKQVAYNTTANVSMYDSVLFT